MTKMIYLFSGKTAEGRSEQKALLGGKGANLAEMASLGISVPPGFTITTEVCTDYYKSSPPKSPTGCLPKSRNQSPGWKARLVRSSRIPPTHCW